MRAAWLTDIHLNFLRTLELKEFVAMLHAGNADSLLISGDIGEAHDLPLYLELIERELARPIYFVLGNHDFYRGSIRGVRDAVGDLCAARPHLHYLTQSEPIELAPGVGVVGHDGWADGRYGDYPHSPVMLSDFALIEELVPHTRRSRWEVLKQLADEAAAHVRRVLPAALERFERVLLLTHVPPLREACLYEGQPSNDEWAPHFASKAMGDVILEIMPAWPARRLTVLCGHTHGRGRCQPLPNVEVLTGGGEYGKPAIEEVFEF